MDNFDPKIPGEAGRPGDMMTTAPFLVTNDTAGRRLAIDLGTVDPFYALIVSTDGAGNFGWQEVQRQPLPLQWNVPQLLVGGPFLRFGFPNFNPAVENTKNLNVPIGAVVLLFPGFWDVNRGQDFRFAFPAGAQTPRLFVRMTADAVPNSHPEFVQGAANAYVQKWNAPNSDWEDDLTRSIWVTCSASMPSLLNFDCSNGRPPIRQCDRFWVEWHSAGFWVPTGPAERNAGIRLTNDPVNADGLYTGYIQIFNLIKMRDEDGARVFVYDSNQLGLLPGIYAGCDLIEHTEGQQIYRATCCVFPDEHSGSDSSGSTSGSDSTSGSGPSGSGSTSGSGSGSIQPGSGGCVPDACGPCPPGSMAWSWLLTVNGTQAPLCDVFKGQFVMNYVGACSWATSSYVDQTPNGGSYGPTWAVTYVGGVWRISAAGTPLPFAVITQPGGCNTPVTFDLHGGWIWGLTHGCPTPTPLVMTPLANCDSGSVSGSASGSGSGVTPPSGACATICYQCPGGTHCQYAVDLTGFSDVGGSCPDCTNTPYRFSYQGSSAGFGGCLLSLNQTWQVDQSIGCAWDHLSPTGDRLLISLVGSAITAQFTTGGPLPGQATYMGTINANECCQPVLFTLQSKDCPFGVPAAPATLVMYPQCGTPAPGCDRLNVGVMTLTNDADCDWRGNVNGVGGFLLKTPGAWTFTVNDFLGHYAIYSSKEGGCCGDHTLYLKSSTCRAPKTLTLSAVGNCDNCCSGSSGSSGSSSAGPPVTTFCRPTPLPSTLMLTITPQSDPSTSCPCVAASQTVPIVYDPANHWWTAVFALQNCGRTLTAHFYCEDDVFHDGGNGWLLDLTCVRTDGGTPDCFAPLEMILYGSNTPLVVTNYSDQGQGWGCVAADFNLVFTVTES